MALWKFNGEKNTGPGGDIGSDASYSSGHQPSFDGTKKGKRNVIATEEGWVRRVIGSGARTGRVHDEILVAATPAGAASLVDGYANTVYLGQPDVAEIYVTTAANAEHTTLLANGNVSVTGGAQAMTVHLVFNEPVVFNASGNTMTLTMTATSSGSTETFTANQTAGAIHTANNIVPFTSTGTVALGTYKIHSQTISATGTPLRAIAPNGHGASANLIVTGAVSNTLPAITIAS
jgi:hypothetical protein